MKYALWTSYPGPDTRRQSFGQRLAWKVKLCLVLFFAVVFLMPWFLVINTSSANTYVAPGHGHWNLRIDLGAPSTDDRWVTLDNDSGPQGQFASGTTCYDDDRDGNCDRDVTPPPPPPTPMYYYASESLAGLKVAQRKAYSTAPSFELSPTAGLKTVYIKIEFSDSGYAIGSDTIYLNTVITSFNINRGDASTTTRKVRLTNEVSAIPVSYRAWEDTRPPTGLPYDSAPEFMLSASAGLKTVHLEVTDANGNVSSASDTIELIGPSITSFSINGGDASTTSKWVRLYYTVADNPAVTADNPTEYMTTFRDDFGTILGTWKPYRASPLDFELSVPGLNGVTGLKTVSFRVRNAEGVLSAEVYDSIELLGPTVTSFRINSGISSTTNNRLLLDNRTTGSPTHYMASTSSGFRNGTWLPYSAWPTKPTFTVDVTAGVKTVYFKVKNNSGIESPVKVDSIELTGPKVASFSLDKGAFNTTDRVVTLDHSVTTGSNPTHYIASESSTFDRGLAIWKPYTPSLTFTLSATAGRKTVYFMVKDSNGIVSPVVSDSIMLVGPSVLSFSIQGDDKLGTTSRTVTIKNVAMGNPNPTHYMASESPGFSGAVWQSPCLGEIRFTINSAGTGTKKVYFKVKNSYGVESPLVSDSITLLSLPVAKAGNDQTVRNKSVVTLDGSKSHDYSASEGLTYEWQIVSTPPGSKAVLSDKKAVNPTFKPDVRGDYKVRLIVKNKGAKVSAPDTVVISTRNSKPVADAGRDRFMASLNTVVNLDGTQSYDTDGEPLQYRWTFVSKPEGSDVIIEDADKVNASFMADVYGEYIAKLEVSDTRGHTVSDTVAMSPHNIMPVANAGTSRSARVGDTIALEGIGMDENWDGLAYKWAIASRPVGSNVVIDDPAACETSFVPDVAGAYVVQLFVSDGSLVSNPDTIQIQAVKDQAGATIAIKGLEDGIKAMDSGAFRNAGMKNALLNKLNAAMANVDAGNHADAMNQLKNDILPKIGNGKNAVEGDKNSWIVDGNSQMTLHQFVRNVTGN